MNLEELTQIIRNRRSIGPHLFSDKKVSDEIIIQAIENANWAPNHKKTEPWRFHIIHKDGLKRLAEWASLAYEKNTPQEKFNPLKQKKLTEKVHLSSHVVALILHRDKKESLPEWEEIAALSMAVQNFWLSLDAAGAHGYWSSPAAIMKDYHEFHPLEENEKCLGFFYVGYKKDEIKIESKRGPLEEKVVWLSN